MDSIIELHQSTFNSVDNRQPKENLLAGELKKLQEHKLRLKEENADYLRRHPELKNYLDEFIAAILSKKPNDIVSFGSDFFSKLKAVVPQNVQPTANGLKPLVICGPSGVGKGTLVNMLMEKYPKFFGFCVSHTTRQPRPGEEDGKHYNFVEKTAMESAIAAGEFIEFANVHTNIYGTSYKAVEMVQQLGKVCVLDIDIQGVQNVKKSTITCNYVFIAPPSLAELESRLRGRGTETDEKIKIRLENARGEMVFGATPGNFNATIFNDNLETAFHELVTLLKTWYPELDLSE